MAGKTTRPKEGATVRRKPAAKADDPAQSKRFLDAAREAQADESQEGADRAFKRVVRQSKQKGRTRGNAS